MNAYEQGDEVILDVARYERMWVKNSSDFNYPAYLSRYPEPPISFLEFTKA